MSGPVPQHRNVAGRYELESILGSGGTGMVWRALDQMLERDVAVKEVVFPAHLPADRDNLRARVLREARTAARLTHPGVTTVYDVVQDDGRAYIVMELVPGPTLAARVAQHGALAPKAVAELGLDLVAPLEAAHRGGIVHRDVKPSNVLLPPDGHAKLTDFGLARLADDPSLTTTGNVLGTPSYMSPEQAEAGPTGPPTDVWGLGATLWYAAEGASPFERPGVVPTLTAIMRDEPPQPHHDGPLDAVLRRMLAKDPAGRPPLRDVREELLDVLDELAAPEPVAPARTRAAAAPAGGGDDWQPAMAAGRRRRRPRRGLVAALLAVVALAVAAAGAVLVPRLTAGQESVTAPPVGAPSAAEPSTPPVASEPTPSEPVPSEPAELAPSEAAPESEVADEASAVPADWVTYSGGPGYTLRYPPGWQVERVDATRTDFRDPASGTYLRVDYTDEPIDPPERAWQELSPAFGARQDNYEELTIEPTEFKGFDAALWEYTYEARGNPLHAANLGFVTGPYAFALNFQTAEDDWESSQELYQMLQASFQAPTS